MITIAIKIQIWCSISRNYFVKASESFLNHRNQSKKVCEFLLRLVSLFLHPIQGFCPVKAKWKKGEHEHRSSSLFWIEMWKRFPLEIGFWYLNNCLMKFLFFSLVYHLMGVSRGTVDNYGLFVAENQQLVYM